VLIIGPTDDQLERDIEEIRPKLLEAIRHAREMARQSNTIILGSLTTESATPLVSENGATRNCPYCAEQIASEAVKCKHCGEFLVPKLRDRERRADYGNRKWSPGVAALLSLIIPGAGQIYREHILSGLLWLLLVPIGYFFLVCPGVILHLLCIVFAASGDPFE